MQLACTNEYMDAWIRLASGEDAWQPIIEWKTAVYAEMKANEHYLIIAEPLNWWEKFLSLTFLYPKRWQLLRFELIRNQFHLAFGNGNKVTFENGSFEAKIDIDKHFRRKISIIMHNGERFAFFESLTGIASSDFDLIIQLLGARESGMMRFTTSLMRFNQQLSKVMPNHSFRKSQTKAG